MREVEREAGERYGDRLAVEWRSFLLRPEPDPSRTLEKFKAYTRSWERAAQEEARARFRIWSTEEGPPSHSIPPHLVAKLAARADPEAFQILHRRLLEAYFSDNRDITSAAVLEEIWAATGLPEEKLSPATDPAVAGEIVREIIDEHNEAIRHGAGGVPAARIEGLEGILMGAQPTEVYRRWIDRALAGEL